MRSIKNGLARTGHMVEIIQTMKQIAVSANNLWQVLNELFKRIPISIKITKLLQGQALQFWDECGYCQECSRQTLVSFP